MDTRAEYLEELPDQDDFLTDDGVEEDKPELFEQYAFKADPGQSLLRIDKFLVCHIAQVSRNRIQDAAEAGMIQVNGQAVKSNYRVKPGDDIRVMVPYPPRSTEIVAEDIPLNIVYQDQDLLVVNKAAGMVVHPGHGNFSGTLVNALAWHFKNDSAFSPDDPRPGLVHRIDKNTSGLLVVAKNPEAKTVLARQFFEKTSQRSYQALVWGRVEQDQGRIDCPIGRSRNDRLQMTVCEQDDPCGKQAVTHYRVLEQFGYVTLVECSLETGRTHQIRVHMKHLGHPLFNDERYGGNQILKGTRYSKYKQFVENCFTLCPRQALHAKTLGFQHPSKDEAMFFDSELPDDMLQLIDKWRKYTAGREDFV